MQINARLISIGGAIAAAGGFAWLAKIAVIAATDGATSGAADAVTAVFYIAGVALMTTGLAVCGVALTAGRHIALRALAGGVGFFSALVAYMVIESIAQGIVGEAGPSWFEDEVGILATGAVIMAFSLTAVRTAQQRANVPHSPLAD